MSEQERAEEGAIDQLVRNIATPLQNDPLRNQHASGEMMEPISDLNIQLGKLNPHEDSISVEEAVNNLSSEVVGQNYWSVKNVESKWNCALECQKKGRFSQQQQRILTTAVGQFLAFSEITYDQFLTILNQKNIVNHILKRYNFFNLLANLLPNRSAQSCYRFLKRTFSNCNRKGRWTAEEEEMLLEWVERQGRDWVYIGKMMGRSSDNVYDKYRSMGEGNASRRKKCSWTLKELVTLLREVEYRSCPFLNKAITSQLQQEVRHNTLDHLDRQKASYHTTKSHFHNSELILKYISPAIKEINLDHMNWSTISAKLATRSFIDCKNKFMQILEVVFKRDRTEQREIVQFMIDQGVREEKEVDWRKWRGEMSEQQARNRFIFLKKLVPSKTIKPFPTLLEELKTKLIVKSSSKQ